MDPIPETVEAINELDPSDEDGGLVEHLTGLASLARRVVPELVGVSVAQLKDRLTFTLVATDDEIAALDGVQYAAGGPCVDGAHEGEATTFDSDRVLDETAWRLFAEATAARAIRSTLTVPLLDDTKAVAGTVNLYAASPGAFSGHEDAVAEIFGGWAAGAVSNADLAFRTRQEAEATPERIRDRNLIDVATGMLAAQLQVDVDTARARLSDAAVRAGVHLVDLARSIVDARKAKGQGEI